LLEKESRELAASRAFWLLLIVTGALVGHSIMSASELYAEASGIGGGPSALAQGLSPLEGIVVPTLGAYDLAATLLFPFVVIRLVAVEKQSGALELMLQAPTRFGASIVAKGIVLLVAWAVSLLAGGVALAAWMAIGGHLYAPETWTVVLGYLLRGVLAIGIGAAAGALAASAASAAIIALTVTIGTWALDYVAAARGGTIAAIAQYTPTSALASFEHGDLRLSTVLILTTIGLAGLAVAAAWLREGRHLPRRVAGVAAALIAATLACVLFAQLRADRDVSEDRRKFVLAGRRSRAASRRRAARDHRLSRCRGSAPHRSRSRSAGEAPANDEVGHRFIRGAKPERVVRGIERSLRRGVVRAWRKTGDEPIEHGTHRARDAVQARGHRAANVGGGTRVSRVSTCQDSDGGAVDILRRVATGGGAGVVAGDGVERARAAWARDRRCWLRVFDIGF
jgi:ABC-type transport system involved in multi-copper enzyme maturation permease subunit